METNRCPSCGAAVDTDVKGNYTCSYCGTKLYINESGKITLTSKTHEIDNNKRKSNNVLIIAIILILAIASIFACLYYFNNNKKQEAPTPIPNHDSSSSTNNTILDVEKLKIGDTFLFGEYEQDNNTTNGKEKIEWIILDRQEKKSLVISKYGLDHIIYNDKFEFTSWEKSSIRKWLNESFISSSFTSNEIKYINNTINTTEYASVNSTNDKIFLLSVTEAETLFNEDKDRSITATAYAIARGVKAYDDGSCWWWLRSVCEDNEYAMNVRSQGNLRYGPDIRVDEEGYAVRPCMWINYDGIQKEQKDTSNVVTTGKIEILDEKMGVYSNPYADREWIRSVYQGNILNYYETKADGTYTWYRIGEKEWIKDDNGSRVKIKQSISNSKNSSSSFTIEILDSKMGVYNSYKEDREWVKSVYEGEKYQCLETYNDGTYYWYRIGKDEWIKDDNGTRVKTLYGDHKNDDAKNGIINNGKSRYKIDGNKLIIYSGNILDIDDIGTCTQDFLNNFGIKTIEVKKDGDISNAHIWSLDSMIIEEGSTSIGKNAFEDTCIEEFYLPSSVKSCREAFISTDWIGTLYFSGNQSELDSLNIPGTRNIKQIIYNYEF